MRADALNRGYMWPMRAFISSHSVGAERVRLQKEEGQAWGGRASVLLH